MKSFASFITENIKASQKIVDELNMRFSGDGRKFGPVELKRIRLDLPVGINTKVPAIGNIKIDTRFRSVDDLNPEYVLAGTKANDDKIFNEVLQSIRFQMKSRPFKSSKKDISKEFEIIKIDKLLYFVEAKAKIIWIIEEAELIKAPVRKFV